MFHLWTQKQEKIRDDRSHTEEASWFEFDGWLNSSSNQNISNKNILALVELDIFFHGFYFESISYVCIFLIAIRPYRIK